MEPHLPFLLLRARPHEEDRDEFRRWFTGTHLRDAKRIPGVASVEAGETKAGTFLAFYTFRSAEAVQEALNSPQAAYARGTVEQWTPRLEELLIEMFTPLGSLPMYQSIN